MTRGTEFWSEYIVHIPTPEAFGDKAKEKAELLADVRYLLHVGSLMRPRRLAKLAEEKFGLRHVGTYFNIAEDYEICDREYCVEVVDLGLESGEKMAIVSHGIGGSGAEIVIKEMRSLIHWSTAYLGRDESKVQVRCVGRSGTRGTIGDVPYGTVGISTVSYNDDFDVAVPTQNSINSSSNVLKNSIFLMPSALVLPPIIFGLVRDAMCPMKVTFRHTLSTNALNVHRISFGTLSSEVSSSSKWKIIPCMPSATNSALQVLPSVA